MKRSLLFLLLFTPASMSCAQSASDPDAAVPDSSQALVQAPGPAWRTFEEAITTAEQNGKKVLVDIYAPWCGWCRRLQREVYTDGAVLEYLAEHYEVARLNGDDDEEQRQFRGVTLSSMELATGLGAEGFPTTVFLDAKGQYLTRLPGFATPDVFLQVLRFVETEAFRSQSFDDFLEQQPN